MQCRFARLDPSSFPACSDRQKPAENLLTTVQKEPTLEDKFAKLQKEASEGNAKAEYDLGILYAKGEGVLKDADMAVNLWQKSAAQGYTKAQNKMGNIFEGRKEDAKALEWYEKAAAQDDVDAQFSLAMTNARNNGMYAADTLAWMQKAAVQGHAEAQFWLAVAYENHYKDVAMALEWYQKSAAQGDTNALYNLGWMYREGKGVPKDAAKAFDWWQKAAMQGNADAQLELGMMYLSGEGVSRNLVLAYAWTNLSAGKKIRLNGNNFTNALISKKEATRAGFRDQLEMVITSAQRAEGQRLSSSWKKGDILQVSNDASLTPSASGGAPTKQRTGTGFIVSFSGYAVSIQPTHLASPPSLMVVHF